MQVLTNRDVKPSGRVLRLCPALCLREARWWLPVEVRKTSNLHYTTALYTISPVFSHHIFVSLDSVSGASDLQHSLVGLDPLAIKSRRIWSFGSNQS